MANEVEYRSCDICYKTLSQKSIAEQADDIKRHYYLHKLERLSKTIHRERFSKDV